MQGLLSGGWIDRRGIPRSREGRRSPRKAGDSGKGGSHLAGKTSSKKSAVKKTTAKKTAKKK
jgi:hypothetical protein